MPDAREWTRNDEEGKIKRDGRETLDLVGLMKKTMRRKQKKKMMMMRKVQAEVEGREKEGRMSVW